MYQSGPTVAFRLALLAAIVGACPACRDSKPAKRQQSAAVAPVADARGPAVAAATWVQPMSNDMLQDWLRTCGQLVGTPAASTDNKTIVITLGNPETGTNCSFGYVPSTMMIQDVQIWVEAKAAEPAQAAFVALTDKTVVPLLPPQVRSMVVSDIAAQKQYATKPLAPFTVAMRNEVARDKVTRWLWLHYDSPKE